ncbi:hypothetical protein KBC04_00310 [Candidatus Babeliales bacterium]|nr:hypothetical protein [Candidatus Babeliales bacterium]MBP9843466.1 hypothetical protein [Candidatus Babeliales bacterium]
MNDSIKKSLLLFCFLATSTQSIFGLTEYEIDKLTAHLPYGGYGIRQKLIKEEEYKKRIKVAIDILKKTPGKIKVNNLSEMEIKFVERALNQIDAESRQKAIRAKLLFPSIGGAMLAASKRANNNNNTPSDRFIIPATLSAVSVAEAIIPPLLIGLLIYKIEHFINGPALAKFLILEEKMNKQEKEHSNEIAQLKKEYREQCETILKHTQVIQDDITQARHQMIGVETNAKQCKKITDHMNRLIKQGVIPQIEKIERDISGLTPQQRDSGTLFDSMENSLDPLDDNIEYRLNNQNGSPVQKKRPAPLQESPAQNSFPPETILTEDGRFSVENFGRKKEKKTGIKNAIGKIFGITKAEPGEKPKF